MQDSSLSRSDWLKVFTHNCQKNEHSSTTTIVTLWFDEDNKEYSLMECWTTPSTGWLEDLLEPTAPYVIKRRYAWATCSSCGFGQRSLSLGRCVCELGTQPLMILIITLEEAQDSCVLKNGFININMVLRKRT